MKQSWSVSCVGRAPEVLEALRCDIQVIRSDVPTEHGRVLDAVVDYVDSCLSVTGFERAVVRVVAHAGGRVLLAPGLRLDVSIVPAAEG